MTKPTYHVELRDNVVAARISGDWSAITDLKYLTALDETISKVRDKKWALYADLRGWRVTEELANAKHNQFIELSRRNQQSECWLIDNLEQGTHIQHHIEAAGVPLQKFTNSTDADTWLIQTQKHLSKINA